MNETVTAAADRRAADDRPGIQSVEVAAGILAAMAKAPGPIKLRELAGACAMPPGKVHRYLVSLVRARLVEQSAETGRYTIGPLAIAVGLAGLNRADLVRAAGDALADLRDRTDETAALAVWGERGPIVVRLEESTQPVTMNVRVGGSLSPDRSAIGRTFLAYLPAAEVEPHLAATEGARPALERSLSEVRDQGLARIEGTLLAGVSAIAAPIFDHRGRVVGVVGVVGRQVELDIGLDGPVAAALRDAAGAISARLGFSG
jgi:DNA-binding IclR family transcriptional regulator